MKAGVAQCRGGRGESVPVDDVCGDVGEGQEVVVDLEGLEGLSGRDAGWGCAGGIQLDLSLGWDAPEYFKDCEYRWQRRTRARDMTHPAVLCWKATSFLEISWLRVVIRITVNEITLFAFS